MEREILSALGMEQHSSGVYGGKWLATPGGPKRECISPVQGKVIGTIGWASEADYDRVLSAAQETFLEWRKVPAPERGLLVREVGNALRESKEALAKLVTLETGKILVEGGGEIQEAIDVADFAVGLSRQLYGKTMHSERRAHRMYEQWHPLGPVGVITAFNFPAAVWAWNAMLAAVCGDVVVWKPSELAPLTAIACTKICAEIASARGFPGLFNLVVGGPEIGQRLAADPRIPLVSATGSCRMGKSVAEEVAKRLGRTILELGGNNAVIVLKDADLDLVIPSTVFGAAGTAGQRCTSTRRILIEREVEAEFTKRMVHAYKQLRVGNPFESGVLVGPLINSRAVESYARALATIKEQGGEILCGGEIVANMPSKMYVRPTIVRARRDMKILREETFAPILYVVGIKDLAEGIEVHNDVPQGLSSAIFTNNLRQAELFLSSQGSDCGIANVNIGTSGAEIGGAFGGEKETGGGRESGSDSWKQYMRRQTNTINFSRELPLAQGIKFEVG